jgi:hypothetical protein
MGQLRPLNEVIYLPEGRRAGGGEWYAAHLWKKPRDLPTLASSSEAKGGLNSALRTQH